MKLILRWYGKNDPISLAHIKQIPTVSGIASAIYDVPPGELWQESSIRWIKNAAHSHGLDFEVVESVPVHEHIKLGKKGSEKLIDVYCENLRRLGRAGICCVCYNFMPVFDWFRTELQHTLPDGSHSLAYREEDLQRLNPRRDNLSLPGWDSSYTKEGLHKLLEEYGAITQDTLLGNLKIFLDAVIPVAKEAGISMALHPDDPPWSILSLPRIVTCEENLEKILSLNSAKEHGLTLCTGSLGANPRNFLPRMAERFASRIHFVHFRNVLHLGGRDFAETAHPSSCGSQDMYAIAKALSNGGFDGYIRPDHGRMIWGEKSPNYGYGLYDRALGATYIVGLFEAIEKNSKE